MGTDSYFQYNARKLKVDKPKPPPEKIGSHHDAKIKTEMEVSESHISDTFIQRLRRKWGA